MALPRRRASALAAERGDYTNGVWVLEDVKELLYTPESRLPAFRGMTTASSCPS